MKEEKTAIPANPKKNANIFASFFFLWTLPILRIGQNREFKTADIAEPLEEYESSRLGERLGYHWSKEVSQSLENPERKPSLWRCIFTMFGWRNIGYGFVFQFTDLGIRLAQPFMIGRILNYFSPNSDITFDEVKWWTVAFVLTIVIKFIVFRHLFFILAMNGIKIRVSLSSLIYRKLVKTSLSTNHETGSGQLINMITNDVTYFDYAPAFAMDILGGIPTLLILIYFIWSEMGSSSIVGIGIVLIFIPIQIMLARKSSSLTVETAKRTDKRMQLMNEIIQGMQPIKMYAWEKKYAESAELLRRKEVYVLRKKAFYVGFTFACYQFLSKMGFFVIALFYSLAGNSITAEKMFSVLVYFSVFEDYITNFLPFAVQQLVRCVISIKRIQSFLLQEEAEHAPQDKTTTENVTIILEHVSAKWSTTQSDFTLNSITTAIEPTMLVSVIGKVGSGKSSLISLILKEMPEHRGKMTVHGTISYASQEPWLFNGSVRENITFGLLMDEQRYNEVLNVCALDADLRGFPDGDQTIIGERGISVSGGQRARISLARAIYRLADIYLLDDPLSAVDSHVGRHIFEKCIKGFLSGKIVVLCTHQLQYVIDSDLIILMDNGTIKAQGAYEHFKTTEGDLENFFVNCVQEQREEREREKETVASSATQDKPEEVEEEISSEGRVSWRIFHAYVRAACSPASCIMLVGVLGGTQALTSGYAYWLSYWVDFEQNFNSTTGNKTILPVLGEINQEKCLWVYGGLLTTLIIFVCLETVSFYYYSMEASKTLHDRMFKAVSKATMGFFNQNPSGRVLSRFSKDMRVIDEALPETLLDTMKCFLQVIGVMIIMSSLKEWLIIAVIGLIGLLIFLRQNFVPTARSLKRLQGVTRSPMCTHANTTMQGLATIRSMKMSEKVIADFDSYQNINSTATVYSLGVSQSFAYYLDALCALYTILSTYTLVFMDTGLSSGEIGLGITQLLSMMFTFHWAIRQSAEVESLMTSVERVLNFQNVESEADNMDSPSKQELPKDWPTKGNIVFDDVCLQYKPTGPFVLKMLSFAIDSKEKVGIVGRTGAGKSSLINALFRLHPTDGRIMIDGVDISSIGLQQLRSNISVIPQAPFLSTGTLRYNLDPFMEFNDDRLWQVLDEVKLKEFVLDLPGKLSSGVSERGANLSVGQRQLICLARALLRRNRILVMDEATANMDTYTDHLIQRTIRQKFSNCTVLTVAHRLHSVMDSDRILVMERGSAVEFGEPYELLQNPESHLNALVNQTGSANASLLRTLAEETYRKKHGKSEP